MLHEKKYLKHVYGYFFQEFQLLVLKQILLVKVSPKKTPYFILFSIDLYFNLAENDVRQLYH